jgi:cell division protein FtsB
MEIILIIFGFVFVVGPLAAAIAKRIAAGETPVERAELARLKAEVERLSSEVARLQDEQSFMLKLLEEGDLKGDQKLLGETTRQF